MQWNGETQDAWETRAKTTGIRVFALVPMQMHNGQWVWLETYVAKAYHNLRGGLNWERYRYSDPALNRHAEKHAPADRPPAPTPTVPKKG